MCLNVCCLVRDLLRQAQGSLSKVLSHLRVVSELELYELSCSHVAVVLDDTRTRIAIQAYQGYSGVRALSLYESCSRWIDNHLQSCHPDLAAALLDTGRHFHIDDAQENFIRRRGVRVKCFNPQALQDDIEERMEIKDEKWVEHWSQIEDKSECATAILFCSRTFLRFDCGLSLLLVAIFNFQKELFLKWQRILHDPIHSPIKNPHSLVNNQLRLQSSAKSGPGESQALLHFYFAQPAYWNRLGEMYAGRMVKVTPLPPVDLDESEPEEGGSTATESLGAGGGAWGGNKALPVSVVAQEEKAMQSTDDPRKCLLCSRNSDDSIEGRMIYIGSDAWVSALYFFFIYPDCLTFGSQKH